MKLPSFKAPLLYPRGAFVICLQRDDAMEWKDGSQGVGALEKREQSRQMREVSGDQNVARLADQAVADPRRGIAGLKVARGGKLGESVARPPERFRGLLRAELAAVPEDIRPDASPRGNGSEPIDGRLPHRRERAARIDVGTNRVAVVHKIEMHGVW